MASPSRLATPDQFHWPKSALCDMKPAEHEHTPEKKHSSKNQKQLNKRSLENYKLITIIHPSLESTSEKPSRLFSLLSSTIQSPLDGSPTPVCCVLGASVPVCVKELAAVIFLTMINGPIQR